MSSLAQEESRSISENCTWGQRKRFADGKVTVPFRRFLGYDRGPKGELILNKEQAEIVKHIYALYLEGKGFYCIATILNEEGVRTASGKSNWCQGAVKSILTNEKCKGDALLQKSFTVNFLTKEKKINEGEIPQYYVKNKHEAIIDPEIWDEVQRYIELRKSYGRKTEQAFLLQNPLRQLWWILRSSNLACRKQIRKGLLAVLEQIPW
nr:recombinase family protein [Corynebacterium poyangense]